MGYTEVGPTDLEVKLNTDDLQPNELDIAYRRGYQEGRLSAKDLYEACKFSLDWLNEEYPNCEPAQKLQQALAKVKGG